MLIKIGNVRFNSDNITFYHPEAKSSIMINTVDGKYYPIGFKSSVERDSALLQLDDDMSQNGFSEIKVN